MSREDQLPRVYLFNLLLAMMVSLVGCQSQSHPWGGEAYQEPTGYTNPPQAIYAPMPTVLPEVNGTAIETDESLEAEFDLLKIDE